MNNFNKKIILGTAQFGMNYGINNSNGVPKKEEVFDTLKYAYLKGINQLDTASNYGNSEKIIGEFFSLNPKLNFKITTKISSKLKSLEDQIHSSLNRLGTSKVDKILFHSLDLYIHFKNEIINFCSKYKGELFDEIGVSTYTNKEIEYLLNENYVERIQAPFNLLDNFRYRGKTFNKIKEKKKKLDVRSVFLQGLFFKNKDEIKTKLKPLRQSINELNNLSKEYKISMEYLALAYVNSFDFIDNILIGVDSKNHLKKNLKNFSANFSNDLKSKVENIVVKDNYLLNPSKW